MQGFYSHPGSQGKAQCVAFPQGLCPFVMHTLPQAPDTHCPPTSHAAFNSKLRGTVCFQTSNQETRPDRVFETRNLYSRRICALRFALEFVISSFCILADFAPPNLPMDSFPSRDWVDSSIHTERSRELISRPSNSLARWLGGPLR